MNRNEFVQRSIIQGMIDQAIKKAFDDLKVSAITLERHHDDCSHLADHIRNHAVNILAESVDLMEDCDE
jgi:hypothetical protein